MRAARQLALAAVVAMSAAHAQQAPDVTPYRPSVSTPAALSAPGWLEIEAGLQRARADDPLRRDSLPYDLKLAFTPDWGLRLSGDAQVWQLNADGSRVRGGGDTSLVLKHRWAVDDASAFGAELGVKQPTAAAGLGSGARDLGLTGIYSSDFAQAWHVDLNLMATRLGAVPAGQGHWQTAWAAALSRNLDAQWGLSGELSGTEQPGTARTGQALLAASFAPRRGLVLDAAVSKGLSAASGGWTLMTGVTFLAGKLF